MADLGISEFSFGFAFLFEHASRHWKNITAAPILPSLQQEAAAGWDAKLPTKGTDFYFQFKIPKWMHGGKARFREDQTYAEPYYQINLHRPECNRQHRTLWQHANTHPHTYYVAPALNSPSEFNNAFLSKRVVAKSCIIPLAKCKDYSANDDLQHYITFTRPGSVFKQHSEPHTGEGYSGEFLGDLYAESRPDWKVIDYEFARRVLNGAFDTVEFAENMRSRRARRIAADLRESLESVDEPRVLLNEASRILAGTFGITLVLVGERQ